MYIKISANMAEMSKLETLKNTLLPKLMPCEINVDNMDILNY
ncbi:MAG: hypothetical protein OSJ45_15890 [Lachnospiraceae bacterium]|nr:hypothetical protein [Lachnospiraceae bacterium]